MGIDGCKSTLACVPDMPKRNTRFFWFDENRGPYIVRTSLAKMAKYDQLIFFDADDKAHPNLVQKTLDCRRPICVYRRMNFNSSSHNGNVRWTVGIFGIRKKLFFDLGGFQPWRCAADSEFHERARRNGIKKMRASPLVLVYRRRHSGNITSMPETAMKSPLRAKYKNMRRQFMADNILKIGLVTADCVPV